MDLYTSNKLIGFDRLNQMLNSFDFANTDKYPPFNHVKLTDDKFVLEFAVAGFSKSDIDISVEDDILTVSGKAKEDSREFKYKGISSRSFNLKFKLLDYVEVTGAELSDGILVVSLERIIPEEKKPKKIQINTTAPEFLTEEKE